MKTELPKDQRRFTPVDISRLREVWPKISWMLDTVRYRCNEHWIPEDIYHQLSSGHCWLLLMVTRPDEIDGILVLQETSEWGKRALNCFVCYHKHPQLTIRNYWEDLVRMATSGGFDIIQMRGPRRNDAVLPVKHHCNIYEYEVRHG